MEIKRFNIDEIKIPFRIIISSKSNSGKSTYCKYLLYKLSNKFDRVYIISYTSEDGYDEIASKYFDYFDQTIIGNIIKHQEKKKTMDINPKYPKESHRKYVYKYPPVCIILDDLCGNVNMVYSQAIDKIYATGRHYNISIILITQKFHAVSNLIRTNASYIILFSHTNKMQIKQLSEEYNSLGSYNEFKKLLDDVTEDYGALIIDNTTNKLKYYWDAAPKKIPYFDFEESDDEK